MKDIGKSSLNNSWGMLQRLMFTVLFAVFAIGAFAQNKVTGTVVDVQGEPIIGASVVVKGTSNGTVTDFDGKFTVANAPAKGNLEISYIGYKTQVLALAGKSQFSVTLEEDRQLLDEVVVVGYGVQKKSDVTGALAHMDAKELTNMPVSNALQAMQGKAAGVDITNSQRPGEVGSITVRGQRSIDASNGPLYVVDGMTIQTGGIENINPADIESIEVLKDASSTAIYGSRGANGVVLVTTKKGKQGKVTLNYSGTVTFSKLSNVAEMMSAAEWLKYSRYAYYNQGAYGDGTPNYDLDYKIYGNVPASWANIEKAWSADHTTFDYSKVGSYDWESAGKRTGIAHEHTLSASGGTDKFSGYGSFGYLNERGVMPGQSYQRFTFNTSFEGKVLPYFTMGVTMNASYGTQEYGYSFTKSTTGAGDYYNALRGMLPWSVPYDADGNFIEYPTGDVNIQNPIDELNYTKNQRKNFRINGSAYGQINFGQIWNQLEGLSYRIQFGPELQYYRAGTANAAEGINGAGRNQIVYNPYQRVAWTLDNIVNYNRTFADIHNVGITLLQSASDFHYESGNIRANVATAEELWYNAHSNNDPTDYSTGLTETSMTSYMARLNYSLMDRYLLTASMRWDGASQLSKGHKWASFPSISLGWRMEQEKFMRNITWIDQLKLRLGWGVSGNAAISAYATKGAIQDLTYTWGKTTEVGYVPSDPNAKSPNMMANQELGWEKTSQWNYGIDYSFLNGRIGGSLDVYTTYTKDLLMSTTIPSLNGYTTTMANVGETSGWGIDLQINALPIKTKDFEWNTVLSWSLDRNKIEKLNNGVTENINRRWFVGEEIGVYYDYVYDGIWKTSEATEAAKYGCKPGQIRVKDLNDDGKLDDNNDRAIVGKVRPRWSAGWRNTFTYKEFELSFFIFSRWKFTVPAGSANLDGRYAMRSLDYWIAGENEDALYYGPGTNGQAQDRYASSMNYQDGSYIKMRNISLGYNFTKKQLKPLGINSLKVYVQAMNPFTIYSKCKWLDTDMMNYDNNTRNFGTTTTIRSWVVGLNVGF
ncbi:TonB-linked outer membrane protein, SusC/RagA family [Prevotella sp. khp1]|uniref:SusC/RagA family TonB-linked outer membrane protein n=1 Tax=Prevotellaceae TaxID=171552 RepID=UPI0008820532|nr:MULTISPECIES: TonB-dependent receptor [Prevotellaceae]QVJ80548.1 TonB-dependent receptor [Xylanibacter ruminicola]SDQ19076.1 TonB-linked outer membrane protein, SusC/RagA family [Prevotella sp. khp1]